MGDAEKIRDRPTKSKNALQTNPRFGTKPPDALRGALSGDDRENFPRVI